MKAIELNTLPHSRAKALLETGVPVYLTVNPVEYHGPHLPLYNDHLLSVAASEDLHERLNRLYPDWPLVFAAPVHMGVDPVPGFGSVAHPYQAVRAAVVRACEGLLALGAKRVILMTFHGSPLHAMAIQAGVEFLRAHGVTSVAPFNWVLHEFMNYKPGAFAHALEPVRDPEIRERISRDLALDFHGGFFETSLVLHYRPEVVSPDYARLPACPQISPQPVFNWLSRALGRLGFARLSAELHFAAYGMGWLKLKPLPGYTGCPHLANAESGARFAEAIMDRYFHGVEAAFTRQEPSPEPIMKWVATLTFGGRLAPH